jgi:hypothetical protein
VVDPLAVNVTDCPGQIPDVTGETVIAGGGITFKVMLAVYKQPPALPLTVYVVVVGGVAVTTLAFAELKVAEGFQVYVLAPVTVKIAELPVQIVVADAAMFKLPDAVVLFITKSSTCAHTLVLPPV